MKEIICTLEKEGFRAHYYPGNREPEKVVISVGGAKCDEKSCIAMSGYLRKAGYNVLVLGFYLWKGLPQNEASVPVDYCEKAVKWLKEKQGIKKIAMTGASFGGAYTLVCASLIPEITCIIPVVPYDHIVEGTVKMKTQRCSTFTFHGKDLPYTNCSIPYATPGRIMRMAIRLKQYGLSRFMRMEYDYFDGTLIPQANVEKDLKMLDYHYGISMLNPESRIKVENSNADILLLAVENDDCWSSETAVRRIVEKLKSVNYKKRVEFQIYEKGSHILTDGLTEFGSVTALMAFLMVPSERKYPKESEEARQDSFKRILKFLEEWQ